ncbi:hypothetical protein [Falsibacillus pallidus]|uniref:Prolipoprotein diacylglyceryl transferase n=1 Tax=Falsibacillus pallidus TaxID=493781 RepID=A0A370GGB1_9BACI|nr:hypothetical protein [Falsibacillus pallidus]RDI41003.1 hypothetical protein DFR59_1104 [Falsibacillus pallidus]
MEWYHIGAFTFPATWGAFVFSGVLAVLLTYLIKQGKLADIYSNALLLLLASWKLSQLIFDFQGTVSNPISLLYFHGGRKGFIFGLALTMLYLYRKIEKERFSTAILFGITVYQVMLYELASRILNNQTGIGFYASLAVFVVVALFVWRKWNDRMWMFQMSILFLLLQGIIYALEGKLASFSMLVYLVLFGVFAILLKKEVKI